VLGIFYSNFIFSIDQLQRGQLIQTSNSENHRTVKSFNSTNKKMKLTFSNGNDNRYQAQEADTTIHNPLWKLFKIIQIM